MIKYRRMLINGIILTVLLAIFSTAIWTAIAESEVKVGYLDTSYNWTGLGGYVASGIGTLNDQNGTINVSGIPENSSVETAFIYWASTNSTSLIPDDQITLNSSSINGTLIGIDRLSLDKYWHMYRSEITSLITDNGNYTIGDLNNVFGASIVVVYSNNNSPSTRVIIADGADNNGNSGATGNMTPVTFSGFTVPDSFQAYLTYIIGDGEIDYNESYYFNDNLIATNEANGSDGHGDIGGWDTDTYEVTGHLSEGDTNATANVFEGPDPGDELGWEVCIFSITLSDENNPPDWPEAGLP